MPFAIELFLDPAAADAVRAIWRTLADAGVSRTMLESGAHPHVSLAVSANLDAERFRPVLEVGARETRPLECSLASLGAFPTEEGVVFVAPVVTRRLLDVHQAVYARLRQFGAACSAYYRPGNWVPHCTLATGVAPDALPEAVRVCLATHAAALPIAGRFERVALVEFRPVTVRHAFPLGST